MSVASTLARGSRAQNGAIATAPTLEELSVAHAPLGGVLRVPLEGHEAARLGENSPGLWHRQAPARFFGLSLTSDQDKVRVVRLSVEGDLGWNARWTEWKWTPRAVSEHEGAEAVSDRDRVDEDGRLILGVLAGETREIRLEIRPVLDETARSGTYFLDVAIEEISLGASDSKEEVLGREIRQLMVELRHPESNYLKQLPGIYARPSITGLVSEADDLPFPGDVDQPFFERFLRGFEDARRPLEIGVAQLHLLWSPRSAPADFLPWLSTWVALTLDETWPELKRRRLIAEAVELYRWRGTKRGLSRYIEIYTGIRPEISDAPFKGFTLGPTAKMGSPEARLGGAQAHTFSVSLAVPDGQKVDAAKVRAIIESQKPAHTAYRLNILGGTSDDSSKP